jgi:hypothetical protein
MANFFDEITPLLQAEGGLNTNPADRGGLTKFGISKKNNPDIDIESLTPKDAARIYKTRYWDAIGGDDLPQETATVAFDAAVNHGVGRAKNLLKATGGDPVKMLQSRKRLYDSIVQNDPSQEQFYNGWMNRLKGISQRLGNSVIGTAEASDFNPEEYKQFLAQQKEPEFNPDEYKQFLASKQPQKIDPTNGMSTTDKLLAGIGGAMTDLGQGVGQTLGLVSPEDVAEKRKLDKPLLDTTAGTVGNIAGNIATAIPTAFIPGANTLKGAALIGAGYGTLQPAESVNEVLGNAAIGSAANTAGVKAGQILSRPSQTISPTIAQKVAKEGIDAGYVVPPTQVNPTFLNRTLEGFSGKITTAQNASAKNQSVTNELAKKAINADELSPSGLAIVRNNANKAYDELGSVGKFKVDKEFSDALDKAGEQTKQMLQDFPELQNQQVTKLVESMQNKGEFNAQSTIEAIKRLRSDAATNKIALDPEKKGLGRAQSNIAKSLEDLIDRNLQKIGKTELLSKYRNARQTLAKTYDIEKALNPASENIDASKFAALLKKNRPLTDELKQIAEFSAQFPKATQMPEKMGSLPQSSPLDWAAGGLLSAGTGNPAMLASVLARPAARSLVLSNAIQKGLVKQPSPGIRLNSGIAEKLGSIFTGLAID